jgi:hypothetical protein
MLQKDRGVSVEGRWIVPAVVRVRGVWACVCECASDGVCVCVYTQSMCVNEVGAEEAC